MNRAFVTDRGDAGRRLDLVLRRHLAAVDSATRTRLQAWIGAGRVSVNGRAVLRVAARAALGDRVVVALPDERPRQVMTAERLPLTVVYEDDWLLAIDKPAGIVVHPAFRNTTGTVMNALLWRARSWPPGTRPSIVGRLDKLTSGLVVVAKTSAMHAALQRALGAADAVKDYLAIVYGRVARARGRIELRLAKDRRDRRRVVASTTEGAPSLTRYERLAGIAAPKAGLAVLRCSLATGRPHQIRVHLAASGWPIVGDPLYGEPRWNLVVDPALAELLRGFPRQALHACRTAFVHPMTRARVEIEVPPPSDFEQLVRATGLPSL